MASVKKPNMDIHSFFFSAPWCGPCKLIKPFYYEKVKQIYTMNGITCTEHCYDDEHTEEMMNALGVKKIPTLCVIKMPSYIESHITNEPENEKEWVDYLEMLKVCDADSSIGTFEVLYSSTGADIEKTAMDAISSFCLDEDF